MTGPSRSSSGPVLSDMPGPTNFTGRGRRFSRAVITALCLLLLIILAAILIWFIPPGFPVREEADGSALYPAPVITEGKPGTPANGSGTRPLAITTFAAPASSRADRSPGTVIVISGSAPLSCTPSAGAGNGPEIPVTDTGLIEARVHEEVNRARTRNNLSVIGTDSALASVARAHSTDMAAHGYFGHINLQEMDATARGAASGYRCSKGRDTSFTYPITENLYADYQYDSEVYTGCSLTGAGWKTEAMLAADAVEAWLKSPDHRRNLLDQHVEREGIGVAVSDTGLVFVTENMC